MTRVNGLLLGAFITSCILSFGLWINNQVSLNVELVDNIPARVLSTTETDTELVRKKQSAYSNLIKTGDSGVNASYAWQKPSSERAESMRNLIENELAEYSEDYLEAVGLKEIILIDGIKTHTGSPVLGFADPFRGQIYLNTIQVEGENSRAIVAEQTFHHELAHILAYEQYGYGFEKNSEWAKLAEDFEYGRHNISKSEYFPKDGFVTSYSMRSASEDFAEVYSLIFTDYFQPMLEKEASRSQLLNEKVRIVYQLINETNRDQCLRSPQIVSNGCDQE